MRAKPITRYAFALAAGGAVSAAGCATIHSRLYETDETGVRQEVKLRGMPVTIDVPTHLKVEVVEHHFYVAAPDGKLTRALIKPTRELAYDLKSTKELYTTDFKRPASGSVDLGLTMKGQYFSKITDNTVDTTITDVAALVQAVIANSPALFGATKAVAKADQAAGGDAGLQVVTLSVASEVFDIRQPNLEGRMQAFLDQHVNRCGERCAAVAGPCISGQAAFSVLGH